MFFKKPHLLYPLFFLIVILFNCFPCESIITLPYSSIHGGETFIKMSLYGSITFLVNQQIHTTYVLDSKLNPLDIESTDTIIIKQKEYKRNLIRETFYLTSFSGVSLKCYQIYLPTNLKTVYSGLSFSYNNCDNGFSLIYALKDKNLIEHLQYSFVPTDIEKGNLYVGGLPSDVINNKQKAQCNINNERWGCDLSEVIMNNRRYRNNHNAFFQAKYKYIYAPKEYIDFLYYNIFKEFFDDNKCSVSTYFNDNYKSFECDYIASLFNKLPSNFIFIFDNTQYIIPLYSLVYKYKDLGDNVYFKFGIVEALEETEKDVWMFGSSFLTHYISSFDYETKQITFYSDEPFITGNNSIVSIVVIINIFDIIIFSGILLSIFTLYYI